MDTETVTGPQQLVTRLYALLVRFHPYDFRTEFVEEMRAVLGDALAEADEKGTLSLIAVCLREARDLPLACCARSCPISEIGERGHQ